MRRTGFVASDKSSGRITTLQKMLLPNSFIIVNNELKTVSKDKISQIFYAI